MKLKRAGRPPLVAGGLSVHVGVTLPAKQFDDLCARAKRDEISLPEVIRRMLAASQLKSKK